LIATDRDAELNWLKALVKKLADKVNAPGDTSEARLGAVEDCVDEGPFTASAWAPPWA
jgi:hypothetical protein